MPPQPRRRDFCRVVEEGGVALDRRPFADAPCGLADDLGSRQPPLMVPA